MSIASDFILCCIQLVSGAAPRDYKAHYLFDPHGQGLLENARFSAYTSTKGANFDVVMLVGGYNECLAHFRAS